MNVTRTQLGAACAALACALALAACVPTDDPPANGDDGYEPYRPDMTGEQDAAADDMAGGEGADMSGGDADMPGEVGVDMGGEGGDMADGEDMGERFCMPNGDGQITRAEVPLRAGLYATYKVATDTPVDTVGEEQGDGTRRWDLSGELENDHRVVVEALDPRGRWFSPDFTEASYVTPLSDEDDLLGVFQINDEALLLLGVVSPEDGLYATNFSYDPPVVVLDFPIEDGKTWTTESTVSGTALGVPVYYSEDYTSQVDATGELETPYGTFDVMRVRVELERVINFIPTDVRTYMFVSECFGTVATMRSEDNEGEVEFTTAAEVRRLTR